MDTSVTLRDRLDRHVQRGFLRLGAGMSRFQARHALEEALRLSELPGEAEGRQYYFRRVSLTTVPVQAARSIWIARVQRVLEDLAAAAVHGADPRAPAHSAVYFDHRDQVLETLLRWALLPASRLPWFASAALGLPPGAGSPAVIVSIVDRLHHTDIPKAAAAAFIVAGLGDSDPTALLTVLPAGAVRNWLRGMEGSGGPQGASVAQPLSVPLMRGLGQAADMFGWADPRVVWLAALDVLTAAPATPPQVAVMRARSTLQRLNVLRSGPIGRATDLRGEGLACGAGDDQVPMEARSSGLPEETPHRSWRDSASGDSLSGQFPAAPAMKPSRTPMLDSGQTAAEPGVTSGQLSEAREISPSAEALDDMPPLGASTAAAGLYFLLPVLRRLGIAAVLESHPELRDAGFVAHLLRRLAARADVAQSDLILRCLTVSEPELLITPETLLRRAGAASVLPTNFSHGATDTLLNGEALLRLWVVAVRCWCWRHGRLTLHQVIRRNGRVWVTRAELDVTLALGDADIRIRRVGMDIDPGWVPWFGAFGRVVRFHYRRLELGGVGR